jgi:long-chain acyl-CoA synthetase
MNLAAIIDQATRVFGDKPAIIFGQQTINYLSLKNAVDRIAGHFLSWGLRPDDRVALLAPNSPQWVAAYYGLIKAGGVAVCLSAAYKRGEIEHLLNDSQARFLITTEALQPELPEEKYVPELEKVFLLEKEPLSSIFADKKDEPHLHRTVDREQDDICVVLYTGGTTGKPKGAMLTHKNILFTAQNVCYHEQTKLSDKALCFMPLNHVFGGIHIMNGTFYGCATLVLHKSFDLDEVLDSIQANGVTRFYAVPTVYIRLINSPRAPEKFKSVTYCFSAATSMASEIVRQWQDKFNLTIHESYGMTETASLVTFNHLYRHRIGSVGTMAGVVEVRLVDSNGDPVPVGETGEITIRGPNIMKGYFNRPEETKETLKDGWLYSGDIGRFDQEGYLYVVDRIKDLIISGGLNVYPSEVEGVLYTHPAIDECAVVGMPHAEYGEAVTAFVIPNNDLKVTEAELIAHCKKYIASYKAPKSVVFVEDLPKSAAGKILRRKIREVLTSQVVGPLQTQGT